MVFNDFHIQQLLLRTPLKIFVYFNACCVPVGEIISTQSEISVLANNLLGSSGGPATSQQLIRPPIRLEASGRFPVR